MPHRAPISVVIPCYACQDTIERTITSIFAQTLLPQEIICVYDCSGDGSLEMLYELQAKDSTKLIKIIELDKNSGPSIARNTGWDVAKGEYIAFLDADDIWHPEKLKIQYEFMENNKDVFLCGHQCLVLKDDFLELSLPVKSYQISKLKLLLSNQFGTPAIMLKRKISQRFNHNKTHAEDYLLWLEIVFAGFKTYKLLIPLAYLLKPEYGAGGLSGDLPAMDRGVRDTYWRLYQEKRISLFIAIMLQIYAKLKHFRRVLKVKFNLV